MRYYREHPEEIQDEDRTFTQDQLDIIERMKSEEEVEPEYNKEHWNYDTNTRKFIRTDDEWDLPR